jgi:hypothetical protein
MLLNAFLVIITLFLANTNAQCPQFWWPMGYFNNSINFFTEVMNGNNIAFYDQSPSVNAIATGSIYGTADRLGNTGLGGARTIAFIQAGITYMQVNPAVYFCGAFTISMWINHVAVASTILDFKDGTLTNGYRISNAAAGTTPILTPLPAGAGASTAAAAVLTPAAWNFFVVSFSGVTGAFPQFFGSLGSIVTAPAAAQAGSAPITSIPACNTMTRAIIGNAFATPMAASGLSGLLSDLKIYNFAMSLAQVQAKFSAEACNF